MNMASHCAGTRRFVARLLTVNMLLAGTTFWSQPALAKDGTNTVDTPDGGTVTTTTKGKTTHVVKKNKDHAKTEESLSVTEKKKVTTGTVADAVVDEKTVTTTTTTKYKLVHQLETPTTTTTTVVDKFGNPISEEVQIWGDNGKQTGGHFKQGKDGKPQAFDPKTGTYADGSKPTNDKPPTYPEVGEGDKKPENPKKPTKSKGGESKGKSTSKGGDRKPSANDQFQLPSSDEGELPRRVTAHQLLYVEDDQHFEVRVHNSVAYRDTPEGGWVPIRADDPHLYVEVPQGGWTQVYPKKRSPWVGYYKPRPFPEEVHFFDTGSVSHELKYGAGYRGADVSDEERWPGQAAQKREPTDEDFRKVAEAADLDPWHLGAIASYLSGPAFVDLIVRSNWTDADPNADAYNAYVAKVEQVVDQLYPTGLEVGASLDFIFSADPIIETETHTKVTHGHFFLEKEVKVGETLVDIDSLPGGEDRVVPIFKIEHERVNTVKKEKVKTEKDVSVVSDSDVGGNLNMHYWFNRQFGVGVSNAVLSAPGGIVDILSTRAEFRVPIVVPLNDDYVGVAPFIFLGFSGTFGENDSMFGFDCGGGIQFRATNGFGCSIEAGADLNGDQNYGKGSFNVFYSKPLLP